jgi:hypothetical protein
MAHNKSKSLLALGFHIIEYSAVLAVAAAWAFRDYNASAAFVLINGGAHLLIDFFTSKATSYYYRLGKEYPPDSKMQQRCFHNFFAVIGFDQFLHIAILLWSFTALDR